MKGNRDAYNLDGVANVEMNRDHAYMTEFPRGKGNTQLDGVISVDTNSGHVYEADEAYPTGKRVEMDAITDLPLGNGAEMDYAGGTGTITDWPKAFKE